MQHNQAAQQLTAALQQAAGLLQARRVGDARRLLDQLLRKFPKQPDIWHLSGLAARQQGDLDRAEKELRTATKLASHQAPYWGNLANVLYAKKDYLAAEQAYDRAVTLQPRFIDGWINRGLNYSAMQAYDRAIECYDKALAISPGHDKAHHAKASALQSADRMVEAAQEYQVAVKAGAASPRLLTAQARCEQQLGHYDAALTGFAAVLEANAQDGEAGLMQASCLFEAGRHEEAEERLLALLAKFPTDREVLKDLVVVRTAKGHADPLTASYGPVLENHADQLEVWNDYLSLMLKQNRNDEVIELVNRAEQALGRQDTLDMVRAKALAQLGELDESTALMAPLSNSESVAKTLWGAEWARLALRRGAEDEVASDLEAIVHTFPDAMEVWSYLDVIWRRTGDDRAAWLIDYDQHIRRIEVPDLYHDSQFWVDLAADLTSLHKARAHPIDQSLRGGTQTPGNLLSLDRPLIMMLREGLQKALAEYVGRLPQDPKHPFLKHNRGRFRFAGSWSCRLKGQGFHIDHNHPVGWISSACYVALPASVVDSANDSGSIRFGMPPIVGPLAAQPVRVIKPEVGTVALFPSFVWHGTVPFSDDEPRITAVFDAVAAA